MNRPIESRARPVPSGRLRRLARLGGVASNIAGAAALDGARRLAEGHRPQLRDLLLTPGNMARLADELARMRGAAMKLGQLLSMDAGDVLPPELAEILARLRAAADHMPPQQLKRVLTQAWGAGWLSRFQSFDVRPIAAASIGQVHRARLKDGRLLAIKVQYPGVRESTDSDVRNVGALLRLSGLVPEGVATEPLLAEARRQLHEEADYRRESAQLARFRALLADRAEFALPEPLAELSTDRVLAMSFVEGAPLEALDTAPQALRDQVAERLVALALRELFEFRLVQTDPNLANYRVDLETGRIALLDFGAVRAVPEARAEACRGLLAAALTGEREDLAAAALRAEILAEDTAPRHVAALLDLIEMAAAAGRVPDPFDAGRDPLTRRLRDAALALAGDREFTHIPPPDMIFLQRKFAGLYLLARRLGARLPLQRMLAPYL